MRWLRRTGHDPVPAAAASGESAPDPVERTSPGLVAFFEGLSEDRSRAVLDLGPAADSSLRVYSRFARWVRFADLLFTGSPPSSDALPPHPERPYDLIFLWDTLDRLTPDQRPRLIERVALISAPDARLFAVTASSGNAPARTFRFALLDTDRMRYENTGLALDIGAPLFPAEVQRLLAPFQVTRAFTSEIGLREYVAVRHPRRPAIDYDPDL